MSQPKEGKSVDFESRSGLGTGQEILGNKGGELGPREQTCWRKAWVLKLQGLRSKPGVIIWGVPGVDP